MKRGGYIKLKISLCFMGRICKSRGTLGCGDDKDSLRGEIGNHLVSFRLLGQGVPPCAWDGKKQLRWEKEKKVVPLVEQSQEILAWLGELSYQ